MKISKLSIENSNSLDKLLDQLAENLNEKKSVVEKASIEVEKMNQALAKQEQLDEEGSKIENIQTDEEARNLQLLVEKSREVSKEIDSINMAGQNYNKRLEELSIKENELKEKINELLESSTYQEKSQKKFIKGLNSNVSIIDKEIPKEIEIVNQENCQIIKCNTKIANEIADLYRKNITMIVSSEENNDFDKLIEKVKLYNEYEKSYYDKQLEILRRPVDKKEIEEEVKPQIEQNTVDTYEEIKEEKPILEEPMDTKEVEEENIVPLSQLMQPDEFLRRDPLEEQLLKSNMGQLHEKEETKSIFYDRISPEQMNNNKILNIKSGRKEKVLGTFSSDEKVKIELLSNINETSNLSSFESFVTNSAA